MAVLADADRVKTGAHFQRQPLGPFAFTRAQLLAAVAAADQWADDNAAAYNTALPAAFRGTATAQQKAVLLAYVLMRRAGILTTEGD